MATKKKLTEAERFKRRVDRAIQRRDRARWAREVAEARRETQAREEALEAKEAEEARLAALPLSDHDRLKRVPVRPAWTAYTVLDPDVAQTLRALCVSRQTSFLSRISDEDIIQKPQSYTLAVTGTSDAGLLAQFALRATTREREAMWAIVSDYLAALKVDPDHAHILWKRIVEHRGPVPDTVPE